MPQHFRRLLEPSLFNLAFTLLLTHELDAVARREWRILPLLRDLPEQAAELIFIVGHVPLVAVLLAALYPPVAGAVVARRLFSGFCVVHILLHQLLIGHPAYAFDGWLSVGLIWGTGLAGLAHLIVGVLDRGQLRVV